MPGAKEQRSARHSPDESTVVADLGRHIASGRLVLFVGNGVRRIPTRILQVQPGVAPNESRSGPSWQSYMEALWDFVKPRPASPQPGDLEFGEFSRLTAPRQAEWFDRRVRGMFGLTAADATRLRMHLLGYDLHRHPGVPHNRLLELVSRVTLDTLGQRDATVDLVTTNVDCAIEQNLAWAAESSLPVSGSAPALEVHTAEGSAVTWRRADASARGTIRVWKIHGCLEALKESGERDWKVLQEKLAALAPEWKDKGKLTHMFAGSVPTDTLWPGARWRKHAAADRSSVRPSVFTISEYVGLMSRLVTDDPSGVPTDLQKIFTDRPILFVGYDLHEVDIDVVAALHRSMDARGPGTAEPRHYTVRFRKDRGAERHEEERLWQMGIRWWPFQLSALALARLPGELRLADRHEWRYGRLTNPSPAEIRDNLSNPWRTKLQDISAGEWSRAQEALLDALVSDPGLAAPPPLDDGGLRLVIAGLASIWHAFALKNVGDLPSRRRVSAGLAAVDSQVPGGSGLVPAMVAAATAGPDDAGWITFLTNVAREWPRWEEIEEFCLGAGIDIRPLEGSPSANAGARTSHVLLYDPRGDERRSKKPRQRMIMDVDDLVRPHPDHSSDSAVAPAVTSVAGLRRDHILFADKLADRRLLAEWEGPIVFETGSTGDELLDQDGAPTLWTGGLGSLIRTLVCARFREKGEDGRWIADLPQDSIEHALACVATDPDLRTLLQGAPDAGAYVVLINSYGKPLWPPGVGVTHDDEIRYGAWVQTHWHRLGPIFWKVLDRPTKAKVGRPLIVHHSGQSVLGRGFLTTIHEAGLMAHFESADGSRCSIIVRIEEDTSGATLQFVCERRDEGGRVDTLGPVTLDTSPGTNGFLTVPGCESLKVALAKEPRRHTLGAGDTVRGCLAYGLWALMRHDEGAHLRRPNSLEHVLLASCVLASLKCYAGSFVEFLRVVEGVRNTDAWKYLWGFPG